MANTDQENLTRIEENLQLLSKQNAPVADVQAYLKMEGFTPDSWMSDAVPLLERNKKAPAAMPGWASTPLQGATFGFGEEATSAVTSLPEFVEGFRAGGLPKAKEEFSKAYDERLEAERAELDRFAQENPITSFGLEVGGGLPWAFVPFANRAQGARLGVKIGQGIGAGAAAGGLYGFGSGEGGLEERLESGLFGAGTGGLLGGVLPGIGHGIGAGYRAGRQILEDPVERATRRVGRAFVRDLPEETTEAAQRRVAAMPPQGQLADVGENLSGLARSTARRPGPGQRIIKEAVEARNQGQAPRITRGLEDTFDSYSGDFKRSLDVIRQDQQTRAAPLYRQAYKSSVEQTDELSDILHTNAAKSAWTHAKKIASNEGEALPDLFVKEGQGKTARMVLNPEITENGLNMKTWDYLKRGLDSFVESQKTDVTGRWKSGDVGRTANTVRKRLRSELDRQVPVYAKARGIYAGDRALEDALKRGRKIFREDVEFLVDELADYSDSELGVFRKGAFQGLVDEIKKAPDGADIYKRIYGTEKKRELINAALFDDPKAAFEFEQLMKTEQTFRKVRDKIMSGSPTADILAEMSDEVNPETVIDAIQKNPSLTQMLNEGAYKGLRWIAGKLGREDAVGEEVANMLFGGQAGARRFLERWNALQPKPRTGRTRFSPSTTAGMTSGLFAGEM